MKKIKIILADIAYWWSVITDHSEYPLADKKQKEREEIYRRRTED